MITPSFSLTATERVLPKLALDFTTASLDSRVTFTRTTGASNPATYVNSGGVITAATNNQPRFDYDPVTLACKGLLIEESRTNQVKYSEQFDNSNWTTSKSAGASVSANTSVAPDGNTTADSVTFASSNDYLYQSISNYVAVTGQSVTFSIFAKTSTQIIVFGGGTATGTDTYSHTTFQNGWYRQTLTRVFTETTSAKPLQMLPYGIFAGAGTYVIWGAQLEAGAFATSYIPTTTTALTRNADVATITGTDFSDWWQAGRGGVSVSAIPSTVSGTRPLIQFDDATADNLIALRGNTTNPELYIVDSTTPQAQIDAGTIAAGTPYTLTGWWQTDFCAARLNTSAKVIDNSATIPTVTQARLGSDGTNYLNGHLATINYYDQFSSRIYTRRKNKSVFSVL